MAPYSLDAARELQARILYELGTNSLVLIEGTSLPVTLVTSQGLLRLLISYEEGVGGESPDVIVNVAANSEATIPPEDQPFTHLVLQQLGVLFSVQKPRS